MKHPDCNCPNAEHHHGSRTTYVVHKCRCADCREDNRIMQRARVLRSIRAQYAPDDADFVDGDIVRDHLRRLMAQGMGWKRAARQVGVSTSTVYPILYGKHLGNPEHPEHRPPRHKVRRDIAERLLAATLDLADGALVDATGTRRRVQALAAVGWPLSELARRPNIQRSNFRLHEDARQQVTAGTARAVAALYDELWDQQYPNPVTRTRAQAHAKRRRWAPPLAWDDDTIDNPASTPQLGEAAGPRTSRAEIEFLAAQVDTLDELREILGVRTIAALHVQVRRHEATLPRRLYVRHADDISQRLKQQASKRAA